MLGYEDISNKTMTFSNKTNTQLTDTEYDEMEAFTDYLVRSLRERGG